MCIKKIFLNANTKHVSKTRLVVYLINILTSRKCDIFRLMIQKNTYIPTYSSLVFIKIEVNIPTKVNNFIGFNLASRSRLSLFSFKIILILKIYYKDGLLNFIKNDRNIIRKYY